MNDRSSVRPAAAPSFIPRPIPLLKPARPSARPVPRRAAQASGALEPTILLVGANVALEPALWAALARRRLDVETTTPSAVAETVTAGGPKPIRVTLSNPRSTVNRDSSGGLVVGASADSRVAPEPQWDGAAALSAFMVLSSGRAHTTPLSQPRRATSWRRSTSL
jgi:hypothetical protein